MSQKENLLATILEDRVKQTIEKDNFYKNNSDHK